MARSVTITCSVVAGKKARAIGETYSGPDAEKLVRMGRAEWIADATPEPEFTEPEPAPPPVKKKRGRRNKVAKRGPGN